MKNIFKKLFKKKKKVTPFFKERKDIIVETDSAFYKSVQPKLNEIKSKLIPVDYTNLEFDDDDINSYSLENLSTDAKLAVIQIIKDDLKTKKLKLENHIKSLPKLNL